MRDYIYKRLAELGKITLSGEGTEREEAKRKRAFLEGQLEIAHRKGQRKANFDPALVGLLREGPSTTPRSRHEETPLCARKRA